MGWVYDRSSVEGGKDHESKGGAGRRSRLS